MCVASVQPEAAYTTFSTLAYDSVALWETRAFGMAVLNLAANVVLGLAAAWVGMTLGRA